MNLLQQVILIFVIVFVALLIVLLITRKTVEGYRRPFSKDNFGNTNMSTIIIQTFDQFFITSKSWNNLNSEIPKLSKYFNVFILPPVSKSSDRVGYLPTDLYDFNSDWGTEQDLINLISQMTAFNILPVTDVIAQHRESGNEAWFRYRNPTFLGTENVKEADYYKYIDKNLYYPWGNSDSDAPPNYYIPGLPPSFDNSITDVSERLKNCYVKNADSSWSLYSDCRNKRPMYGVTKNSNPSWLQSVNLCNLEVLKVYFIYMKKLKAMGIRGIRIDQADAVSSPFISLFLNSDVTKTRSLLKTITDLCELAKAPQVDKDVVYTLPTDLENVDVAELTNTTFDMRLFENFTYELRAKSTNNKDWRGQLDMLDNVNSPLNTSDWSGCFAYPLKFILNDMFNTKDNTVNGSVFIKEKMLISYEKYKALTVNFVDNHDTIYLNTLIQGISDITKGSPGEELNFYRIIPAYFVILMLPGMPMVNKVHYDVYANLGLDTLMQLRNDCCIDQHCDFDVLTSSTNDVSWKVYKLNLNITGTQPPIIKKPQSPTTSVLLEINEKAPTSDVVWSSLIHGTKIYMKISYV